MATGRYLYCTVVPRVSALSPFRRPASRYAQSARSRPIMAAIPTITLKIEAKLLTQTQFRWLLCEGDGFCFAANIPLKRWVRRRRTEPKA
jgi:hypothetical protein